MSDLNAQFKKQLPRNSFFQVASFATHVLIGIWLVPYMLKHLGRAAYGLIPLAAVMTQYVSLISATISSAVSRFLTVALQRDDVEEANQIFNTALFSYAGLGVIQVPIFATIIYFAGSIFNIPEPLYRDATILLVCSAATFLVHLGFGVFRVPIFANNRLDISRGLDIVSQVGRVVGIVGVFSILEPRLRYVGYVDLTLAIVMAGVQVTISKILAPSLTLNIRHYRWSKVRELTGMGIWMIINQVGALVFLRTDLWVVNKFVSPEAAGEYAAILPWSRMIRQAGGLISGVVAPMVYIYYARSQLTQMVRVSNLAVRLLCVLLAIPISFLCVFSADLLTLWLGPSFRNLAPLMIIMVCHLIVNVGVVPLFSIRTAVNAVKIPAMMTIAMGGVSLLLAILFATRLDWGMHGVALAVAVSLTMKNAFWEPVYMARVLNLPWYAFVKPYLLGLFVFAVLSVAGLLLRWYVEPSNWLELFLMAALFGASGLALAWLILPRNDREAVFDLVPGRFRNLVGKSF